MGWIGVKTHEPTKEFIRKEFNPVHIIQKDKVLYLVNKDPQGDLYASVVKTRKEGSSLWYKSMHESEYPFYFEVPHKILDLLSPTTDPISLAWRASCFDATAKKSKAI